CSQYTIRCNHSAVATTLLVVYTVHNIVQLLLHSWWCTQYTIQCSVVLQNKIYIMSGKLPRRGGSSQATKRGQAASVSTFNSADRGHRAFSAGDHGARLSFFSAAGHVIEPEHVEDLVEWITKLSSTSSSSVTQAQSSSPSNADAKAAYSISSLSTESPKLFDHSDRYLLLEDAQQFEGSDVGSQVEEGSNVSLERGGAQEGQETGSHVPQAAASCQVCASDEEGGDDEVTDSTWVPDRREEEEEEAAQLQRGRMSSRGQLKGSHPTASHRRALKEQGTADSPLILKSFLVWAFFDTSAADRTIAVCNLCLKLIKRSKNSSRLDTTCLTRHMMICHAVRWQQTHIKEKGRLLLAPHLGFPTPLYLQSSQKPARGMKV
ncbi:hypothetical protein AB205_0046920, partial [Aquarana catesbeiana]